MTEDLGESGARNSGIFGARLGTAFAQAIALYLLSEASAAPQSWPATIPALYIPLLLISVYVPLIIHFGLGQIRARPLTIWVAVAAVLIAGLGYHDAVRGTATPAFAIFPAPWLRLQLVLPAALFVAHVLVVDSIIERRLVPPYARHFDTAWKLGVQIVLSAVFVGVFWGVLYLGAGLFKLVDIDVFVRLIEHRWFAYPATTLAIAVAIHTTDVQAGLIRGARSLALTLFSWLLPLLAGIILGFLASLPFVSLAALWKTRFATSLLLTAAGFLVFFINCCYQDGAPEQTRSRIKRVAANVGSIELIPLVALAAWALTLRVEQYGWTVERILAAAVIVVAASYALGYVASVIRAPVWLKRIEITNFITAYLFLAVFLALFSPVADPARLMVADQLARLKAGAVVPGKFDFAALKFDGARWGTAALEELSRAKDGPDAQIISANAVQALAMTSRFAAKQAVTADEMAERVTVYPAGRSLPKELYDTWSKPGPRPFCLMATAATCVARFVTLQPNGPEAILFLDNTGLALYERDATGQWQKTGQLFGGIPCPATRKAVEDGTFSLEPHALPDLVAGGQRLTIAPPMQYSCRN